MITNSYKLAAVITKWLHPNLQQIATAYIGGNAQMRMLLPFVSYISDNTVTKAINGFLSKVPDSILPDMAHSIVDDAIKKGGFTVGNIIFDSKDLQELKKLMDYNLPIEDSQDYTVITEPQTETPKSDGVSSGTNNNTNTK